MMFSCVCSAAMEANNEQRSDMDWMWTPSPAVNASCSVARCCEDEFGSRGAAARPWKKNAGNLEPAPGFAARGHRRGSDGPARLVDRSTTTRHQFATGSVGFASLSEHGPAFVGRS